MHNTGSTLPRRQLGRYLTDWRSRAGLSVVKAAELLEMATSSLYRLEHGEVARVDFRRIEAACDLYGVPDDLKAAFVGLAKQASVKSWWHEFGDLVPKDLDIYMGLEAAAVELHSYQPELIPGLLQTEDYLRAAIRRLPTHTPEPEQERWVRLKMHRQVIVTRKHQPVSIDMVVGEAALRRLNGGPKVMARQLMRVADVSTLPNVEIRILPYAAGFPVGMAPGPFVILDFGLTALQKPVEPQVVFIEGSAIGNMYLEKPEDVARYHGIYNSLRQHALDPADSRILLRRVAKEFQA